MPKTREKDGSSREFREICLKQGIRFTPQRLRIYEVLTGSRNHPTAEMIWEELRDEMPGLSLNTVYRTLITLERMGVVTKLPVTADSARFDGNRADHHHFVCRRCGRIEDIYWPEFDKLISPDKTKQLGQIELIQVRIGGICKNCFATDEKPA